MEGGFRGMGRRAALAVATAGAALFPHRCVRCGKEGMVLCGECEVRINASMRGVFCCPGCGSPSPAGRVCGASRCAASPLSAVVSAAGYAEPHLRELLRQYKYCGILEAGGALARLLDTFLLRNARLMPFPGVASCTSVPMHRIRLALRGHDQAERLGSVAARSLGFPFESHIIRSTFSFVTQARLSDASARRHNAKGRFLPAGKVGGDWIIVDDVYTTGATLCACAAALRAAGAVSVCGLTLLHG